MEKFSALWKIPLSELLHFLKHLTWIASIFTLVLLFSLPESSQPTVGDIFANQVSLEASQGSPPSGEMGQPSASHCQKKSDRA